MLLDGSELFRYRVAGEAEAHMRRTFDEAQQKRGPVVLFIDEIVRHTNTNIACAP